MTTMKCPRYDAAESRLRLKASPRKEPPTITIKPQCPPTIKPQCPPTIKPQCPPTETSTSSLHDKENSTDEALEDSGYLSLHNSQIDEPPGEEEEDRVQKKKTPSPHGSPSKCPGRTGGSSSRPAALEASTSSSSSSSSSSTPVDRHKRRTLSSTPADRRRDPDLPILKFQRAVCEALSRSYQKNKRYDWSVVAKVAEHHFLDRVIGGKMGREHVDALSCLLSRNMWSVLSRVLSLLGDPDLLSCKKVSRSWRRIVCEDRAARGRCQRAEQLLRESSSSLRRRGCGLTRDSVSRVVLSRVQPLAFSSTPSSSSSSSSSSPSCRLLSRTAGTPCNRFNEYLQAAGGLKLHESLRPCRRCGSPATHSSEAQRATCTRLSCRFDFCSGCGAAVHGSTPCRALRPPDTPIVPGARSKRSVRRL